MEANGEPIHAFVPNPPAAPSTRSTAQPRPPLAGLDSRRPVRRVLATAMALWLPALAGSAAESHVARALRLDGPVYFVGELVPEYEERVTGLPSLDDLEDLALELGRTVDGYVAPRSGVQILPFRLSQLAAAPTQRIYASGLRAINEQIVAWLRSAGYRGVRVRPHPEDIDPQTNRDLRPRHETRLRLVVSSGRRGERPTGSVRAEESDGPVYMVDAILPLYAEHHPDHPPLAGLNRAEFLLGRTADGYVAPRPAVRSIRFRLSQLASAPAQPIYASGLRAINQQIVAWLTAQGLAGVFVRPHEEDIDPDTNADLRAEDHSELRLLIWTGRIKAMRTFGSGKRIASEERVDHPAHERIKDHSPIKPGSIRGMDLVDKNVLDDYVARLNRHPGRRIEAALSPAREAGGVNLDFLIAENKPWTLYAQWSDTGTKQTTRARQRFGFTHTQLTGNDDILRAEYLTGDFDEVHAWNLSYEAPWFGSDRLRWRAFASSSRFDASSLALRDLLADPTFEGEQWGGGAELIANVYQRRNLFIDVVGGARWLNVEVNKPRGATAEEFRTAEDSFFLPRLGIVAERHSETSSLLADLSMEWNIASIAGTDADDLNKTRGLQTDPDENWQVLRWYIRLSGFLEPLIADLSGLGSRPRDTSRLAHELSLIFRGQYGFNNRLIPQEQAVAGGLYSVRGYPQAASAADSLFLGSLEYRFHLPRLLPVRSEPLHVPVLGDFRIAPQAFGRPDWDLVLRAFIDAARTRHTDRLAGEEDETLIGAGIGAELQIRRNIIARIDLGFALDETSRLGVERGDNEVHFSVTTLY